MQLNKEIHLVILLLGCVFSSVNGATCTYTHTAGKSGQTSTRVGYFSGKDTSDCEDYCNNDDACMAVDYKISNNACYKHNQLTDLVDDADFKYLLKTCTQATTTATTTLETTTSAPETTTTVTSCSMTRTSNTKGGPLSYTMLTNNLEACASVCLYFRTCTATRFVGSTCILYETTETTMLESESVEYVKYYAMNGCSMARTSGRKPTGANLLSISMTSIEACERVCMTVKNCKATYYNGVVCYFYSMDTTTSADNPSTFAKKECPSGVSSGKLYFGNICNVTTYNHGTSQHHGVSTHRCILAGLTIMLTLFSLARCNTA